MGERVVDVDVLYICTCTYADSYSATRLRSLFLEPNGEMVIIK